MSECVLDTLLINMHEGCRNAKEVHLLFLHWYVPFIEVSSDRCTSGLVASSCNSEKHT